MALTALNLGTESFFSSSFDKDFLVSSLSRVSIHSVELLSDCQRILAGHVFSKFESTDGFPARVEFNKQAKSCLPSTLGSLVRFRLIITSLCFARVIPT